MRVFAAGAGAAIGTRLVPQRSNAATRCSARTGRPLDPSRSTSTRRFVAQRYASARYLRREGMVVLSARQRADARFGDEFRRARESCRETETCLRPSEEG